MGEVEPVLTQLTFRWFYTVFQVQNAEDVIIHSPHMGGLDLERYDAFVGENAGGKTSKLAISLWGCFFLSVL